MAFFSVAQSKIRNYAERMGSISLLCLPLYLFCFLERISRTVNMADNAKSSAKVKTKKKSTRSTKDNSTPTKCPICEDPVKDATAKVRANHGYIAVALAFQKSTLTPSEVCRHLHRITAPTAALCHSLMS